MSQRLHSPGNTSPSLDAALHSAATSADLEGALQDRKKQKKAAERLQELIAQMPSGPRFKAENFAVEFVHDPARGPDFDRRHDALNISHRVVEAFLASTRNDLEELSASIGLNGGFLINYEGVGAERIGAHLTPSTQDQGGWIMAETSGSPIDRRNYQPLPQIVGADGHFYVPADRDGITSAVPLPVDENDIVLNGQQIIDEITNDPACALLIADICSVPEAHQMGFASATEDAVLSEVQKLNRYRNHPLRYAIAAIAGIKGLRNANMEPIGHALNDELLNAVSLILHTRRHLKAPGKWLGKKTSNMVSVELPSGDTGFLDVDWNITAQPLAGLQPRSDVKIKNGF